MEIEVITPRFCPNPYVQIAKDLAGWIYLEPQARATKGQWKSVFSNFNAPLDLEIGCGNGTFFHQLAQNQPTRNFLGIEVKYKPLVQTVRRCKKSGFENSKGIRFDADSIEQIFEKNELDNIFINFPDPWPKRRQQKNRLLKAPFFMKLHQIQKPGGVINFKTDSMDYFDFVLEQLKGLPFETVWCTRDLHRSEFAQDNFVTQFENIFLRQGLPIYALKLTNKAP